MREKINELIAKTHSYGVKWRCSLALLFARVERDDVAKLPCECFHKQVQALYYWESFLDVAIPLTQIIQDKTTGEINNCGFIELQYYEDIGQVTIFMLRYLGNPSGIVQEGIVT